MPTIDFMTLRAIVTADSSQFDQTLGGLGSIAGQVGSVVAKGMAVASAAVTAFGVDSVRTGMSFDQSMSHVSAILGEKSAETIEYNGQTMTAIDALRDYAKEMGRTTMFTASQSADALSYMALAGYDAQQSMEMLPSVFNLAAAGGMDLARASDMVTDAQTALGISFEEMPKFINEMVKAQSTGNTSVEQMGEAMLTIGGLARELNDGYVLLADGTKKPTTGTQELETALVAMANAGIKGSEAGTHMRNMLLKLSSPTADGTKMLNALGVEVFDSTGKMNSLSEILRSLNGAMGQLTQQEKLNAVSELFNTRDTASVEALLSAIEGDWDNIGASILEAGDAAQEASDKMMDNLPGALKYFDSAMEGMKIAVSEKLTPMLTEFVKFGTEAVQGLADAFEKDGLNGVLNALPDILDKGIQMIFDVLPKVLEAAAGLLSAFVTGVVTNLPKLVPAAVQVVKTLVDALAENLPMILDAAVEVIFTLAEGLIDALPDLIPSVVEIILTIAEKLTDPIMLAKVIDVGFKLLEALGEGILNSIPLLIEKVPTIVMNLIENFILQWPQFVASGIDLMIQLALGIVEAIPKVGEAIVKVIAGAGDAFKSRISDAWQWGKDLIQNFIDGVMSKIGSIKSAFSNLGSTIKGYIHFSEPDVGPLSDFSTYAPDMMKEFAKGIRDNEDIVKDQVAKSFDFGGTITGDGFGNGGAINPVFNIYGGENSPKEIAEEVANILTSGELRRRAVYA